MNVNDSSNRNAELNSWQKSDFKSNEYNITLKKDNLKIMSSQNY